MTYTADEFGYPVVDLPQSASSTPADAVKFLVRELVRTGRLEPEYAARVICQVLLRESQGSTGMGRGFALPHSKSDVTDEVLGIVGRLSQPAEWPGAMDNQLVSVVCLLVTPASQPQVSFHATNSVVKMFNGK